MLTAEKLYSLTKDELVQEFSKYIQEAYTYRKASGFEPLAKEWEFIMDLGAFFVWESKQYPQIVQDSVLRAYEVMCEAEKDMDFDMATLAVAVLGFLSYPQQPGEDETMYKLHMMNDFQLWRKQTRQDANGMVN